MDLPPPPGSMDNLPPPLVPSPVNTFPFEDIYTVGRSSEKRWRSFINCLDWDPRKHNSQIMIRRAYHARTLWEASLLLSFTDSSWLSTGAYEMIRDTAHFELRKVELEILSFQLTSGALGIDMNDKGRVYDCAAIFYTPLLWFANRCLSAQKAMLKSKEYREDQKDHARLLHMKPYPHHSPMELARNLDQLIHAVFSFLNHFPIDPNAPDGALAVISRKLKLCIQLVDPIICVIND